MRRQSVILCVRDSTEWDDTTQPGIAGLGPLSYLRRHGLLYGHPTLAVTPDGVPLGVLDAWLWTRDRETFGEDQRHWPIEAKESMRWLEGFARRAGRDPARHPAALRRRPGMRYSRIHGPGAPGARDRLADPGHSQPLPGRRGHTGGPASASAGVGRGQLYPPRATEPTEPAGGADGAGRTGDPAPQGRRTGDGHRAAGTRRVLARRGRTARLAPADQPFGGHARSSR